MLPSILIRQFFASKNASGRKQDYVPTNLKNVIVFDNLFSFVQAQTQNICHHVTSSASWAGSQSEGHWKL